MACFLFYVTCLSGEEIGFVVTHTRTVTHTNTHSHRGVRTDTPTRFVFLGRGAPVLSGLFSVLSCSARTPSKKSAKTIKTMKNVRKFASKKNPVNISSISRDWVCTLRCAPQRVGRARKIRSQLRGLGRSIQRRWASATKDRFFPKRETHPRERENHHHNQ